MQTHTIPHSVFCLLICTQGPYDLPKPIMRYSTISQPSTKSWIYWDIGWIVYLKDHNKMQRIWKYIYYLPAQTELVSWPLNPFSSLTEKKVQRLDDNT